MCRNCHLVVNLGNGSLTDEEEFKVSIIYNLASSILIDSLGVEEGLEEALLRALLFS